MATTPCRFPLGYSGEPDGTVDLYPEGSDTAAASGLTFTEETNREGLYGFDVTQSLTGRHFAVVKDSAGEVIAIIDYALSDTTDEQLPVGRADNRDGAKLPTATEIWTKSKTVLENASGWAGSIGKYLVDKTGLITTDTSITIANNIISGDVLKLQKGSTRSFVVPLAPDDLPNDIIDGDLTGYRLRFGINKLVSTSGTSSLIVDGTLENAGTSDQQVRVKYTTSQTSGFATDDTPVNDNALNTGRAYEYGLSVNNGHDGTAQGGGSSTITLDSDASTRDDIYNEAEIEITSGTGSGQTRTINDYDGSTKQATVDSAWGTQPDGTSVYTITPSVCPELVQGEASVRTKIADCQ